MFRPNTLFIVGAGASAEVGLPVGSGLIERIAPTITYKKDVYGDFTPASEMTDAGFLDRAYRYFGHTNLAQHVPAAKKLLRGLAFANSIDRLIDDHSDDEGLKLWGKAAIVYHILDAERTSQLQIEERTQRPDITKVQGTWYRQFATNLMDGVKATDVENAFDDISIICFNYDRCIEHYLPHAIEEKYSMPIETAREIVDQLKIYHPYGTLGSLVRRSDNRQVVSFGADPKRMPVFEMAEQIKTYAEQVEDGALLKKMRRAVLEAETIVFLGFGYHRENLELIRPKFSAPQPQRVYGTSYMMSEDALARVVEDLDEIILARGPSILPAGHKIKPLPCSKLLEEYSRSLTA